MKSLHIFIRLGLQSVKIQIKQCKINANDNNRGHWPIQCVGNLQSMEEEFSFGP